ncbi:hypothetical protein DXC38_19255 [Bacteroides sp. 3_1_33FAA]|jgi:hypothetical protein|uniref:Uncharacterized protein n=2 Tax=Bacteroidaceae TaxID=815 RepID=A0A414XJQ8_PHOVU|nr:MAG: hypothetical protein BHV68_00560 [Bacteroidales bacterium 43_8]RGK28423.1 hypothetical protein DXD19_19550 [Parabacteroides sp. 20_3]RGL95420.1 hypothetical protein DXC38_19255 [Bacteroides sp. 3_1_33FAA]RHA19000.1 hypothetical protein DW946_17405 [Bacteroides caccae]RHH74175.1 hypothetical protein DW193_19475 [Phocaeicola vulgatus]RHI72320.1 hypothetical protein DW157_10980 [Bacteroides eggerthii]RHL36831.1 hypothetical protein DW027_13725 [Bacteroides xylanisolvens]RJU29570.1 hypot
MTSWKHFLQRKAASSIWNSNAGQTVFLFLLMTPTSKVYNRGDGMYRYKNTGKNFNVRIGTMFEGSNNPAFI